ncbi:hypothetical protein G6031_07000 [Dietzia sp. CQ4]|uniref:hypothetical protein n=1 Tax=Dietzia sp. (strain CQ4) TaxID=370437 RepID=UPI0015FC782F|nr:hypothetical protein [Dietzia sp. CQ4]MBB1034138.1 hypothetical protein [Dietzia sp. CQ4]
MTLLRPYDPPVAIYRNGHAIARVMRNGAEVWSAGGSSGWDWVDDFTSDDLHPRWEPLFGAYNPPGLVNMTVVGPEADEAFRCEIQAGTGGGAVALTAGFSTPISLAHQSNGAVQLANNTTTLTSSGHALGSLLTLKREDGFFRAYIDGFIALADGGGQMMFEDTITDPVNLAVGAYGRIDSVKYRRINSRYVGSGTVVREGTWGPLEVESPGWVFRSYNALDGYSDYGYYDITVEAWGAAGTTAVLDVNESSGQYPGMTALSSTTTTTGSADRSTFAIEGLILGNGDTIWMGATCPVGAPLQGRYLAVRTGDVE